MVSLFVDSLSFIPDYGESEESLGSPTTSETGEIFFYKGKESNEPIPFDAIPNPDKSHQAVKTPDPCSPRSRTDFDLEILSLLEECHSLKESYPDPFHSPSGGLSLNEILHMMDEDGCAYPNLSNHPAMFALKLQDTGNSSDPERRLDIYRALIRHLCSSDLPFSGQQLISRTELSNKVLLLHKLFKDRDEKSFRFQELELKSDLDSFINLLRCTDYENVSPVRINRYISFLISDLEFLTEDKESRPITNPNDPDHFLFDPASYLIQKLLKDFPDSSEDKIMETFFAKRRETYREFVRIFNTTKFPFTSTQKTVIQEISKAVIFTTGDPDSAEDRTFQVSIQKLLLVLNFYDEGPRDGISNVKKVRKAYSQLIDDILTLQQSERRIFQDFEYYSLPSEEMVGNFIESLRLNFIPRYSERLY